VGRVTELADNRETNPKYGIAVGISIKVENIAKAASDIGLTIFTTCPM